MKNVGDVNSRYCQTLVEGMPDARKRQRAYSIPELICGECGFVMERVGVPVPASSKVTYLTRCSNALCQPTLYQFPFVEIELTEV